MYAQKLFLNPRFDIVRNQGMIPALKYIVATTKRYQNFLFHRDSAREYAEKSLDRLLKYKLLWCSSDLVALGVCDVLKAHGIVPGRDIYVVGFDNLESALGNFRESGLTTIDPNWQRGGRMLAELLLDSLESGRSLPERTPWYPEVVYRETFPEDPGSRRRNTNETHKR